MEYILRIGKNSGMKKEGEEKFIRNLIKESSDLFHDISINERLDILDDCFTRTIYSMMSEFTSPEESNMFMNCIHKQLQSKLLIAKTYQKLLLQGAAQKPLSPPFLVQLEAYSKFL